MFVTDAEQTRSCDALMASDFNVPGLLLMEAAGKKLTEFILEKFPDSHFLILCGPGNNGGDGLVSARLLFHLGKSVSVLFSQDPQNSRGDAKQNFEMLEVLPVPRFQWGTSLPDEILHPSAKTVIVDALLGTGIQEAIRGPVAEIVNHYQSLHIPVVAVDLPSGLNAASGQIPGPVLKANYTLSFHLPKICHLVSPASECCGELTIADIGIEESLHARLCLNRRLMTSEVFRDNYRPRSEAAHKGNFGHVLIAGGSKHMAGAIALTGSAALRTGAGLVSAFVPGSVRPAFYRESLEQMCISYGDDTCSHFNADAAEEFLRALPGKTLVVFGPGMGTHPETAEFMERILPEIQCPVVLDADALNLLALHPEWWKHIAEKGILTPHPGEMARLCGWPDVNTRRLETAEKFAFEKKVILVLKGAGTLTAEPNGMTWLNASGNPGMATAGAGDVLTGMIAGMMACGYAAGYAAAAATFLHGIAGDLCAQKRGSMESVTAEGILSEIGFAFEFALSKTDYPIRRI